MTGVPKALLIIHDVGYHLILTKQRMIECFGLEGTFKDHLVQASCHRQGHLSSDKVTQSPIQPELGHLQWWGTQNLPGQPVALFHTSILKNFFLTSNLNLSSFSLKPLSVVLSLQKSLSTYVMSLLYTSKGHSKFSLECFPLQAKQLQLSLSL